MIVSNVALTMLILRPSTCPRALANSGSQPITVWPSDAMNSLGAYVASAATVSVPFDLMAAGTSAAIELTGLADGDCDAVAAGALLLLLLLQPVATSAVTASITPTATSGFRVLWALTRNSVLMGR